jgi:acyl dehydratase
MAIDPRHVGRRYGPFRSTACGERIQAFAVAVAGGVPGYFGDAAASPHPFSADEDAARRSRHGALVAPPTFGVTFAMRPFALACCDPELGLDLLRLLHAEQEFEHGVPVQPGDELVTRGEIVDVHAKGTLDFMTVRTETLNQRGERVLVARWTAVIRG